MPLATLAAVDDRLDTADALQRDDLVRYSGVAASKSSRSASSSRINSMASTSRRRNRSSSAAKWGGNMRPSPSSGLPCRAPGSQRRACADPSSGNKRQDVILDPRSIFALAIHAFAVLLLRCGHTYHAANLAIAPIGNVARKLLAIGDDDDFFGRDSWSAAGPTDRQTDPMKVLRCRGGMVTAQRAPSSSASAIRRQAYAM